MTRSVAARRFEDWAVVRLVRAHPISSGNARASARPARRALISVMTFAFARIGAVVAMRVEDYHPKDKRWWVRLHQEGGKRHEMPAHYNLEAYLDAYIEVARIRDAGKAPSSDPPPAAPAP